MTTENLEQEKKDREATIVGVILFTILALTLLGGLIYRVTRVEGVYGVAGIESLRLEMNDYCRMACGVTSADDPTDLAKKDWINERKSEILAMFDCPVDRDCVPFKCSSEGSRYGPTYAYTEVTDSRRCVDVCNEETALAKWRGMSAEERRAYYDLLYGRGGWNLSAWVERQQ